MDDANKTSNYLFYLYFYHNDIEVTVEVDCRYVRPIDIVHIISCRNVSKSNIHVRLAMGFLLFGCFCRLGKE